MNLFDFDTPYVDLQQLCTLLREVLEHWDAIADLDYEETEYTYCSDVGVAGDYRRTVNVTDGLCDNFLNEFLESVDKDALFFKWRHFSGDYVYPVGGREEYLRFDNETGDLLYQNLFRNPLRKDLVEHILKTIEEYLNESANA